MRFQNNRGKQDNFGGSSKTKVGNQITLAEIPKHRFEILHCQSEVLEDI